jgi:hypothetical protein
MPLRERWLITGSRYGWTQEEVKNGLDSVRAARGIDIRVTVVHGNAQGVDTFAKNWVDHIRFGVEEPYAVSAAEWKLHGAAAGPLRNKKMVSTAPDCAVAFLFRNSVGTTHCISEIKKAGIELYLFCKNMNEEKPRTAQFVNGVEVHWP